MGTPGKRKLPSDTLFDGPVTKRRQNPNTPDLSGWANPSSTCHSRSPQLCGDRPTVARGAQHVPVQGADTDGETGSSGTDVDDLSSSEGSSSDEGDDDNRSRSMGETASTDGDDDLPDDDEEDEDDDDDDDDSGSIQNLSAAHKKPHMSALTAPLDLRRKLSSFLPHLREANAVLQNPSEAQARRLDDVADDAQHYIQMDLGLGVLKHMKPTRTRPGGLNLTGGGRLTSSGEESDSDSAEATTTADGRRADGTFLTDLMRCKPAPSKKPGIQEVPG